MKKETKNKAIVRKISPTDTILSLKAGETAVIAKNDITASTIRATAHRIMMQGARKYIVTTKGRVNETLIVRIK